MNQKKKRTARVLVDRIGRAKEFIVITLHDREIKAEATENGVGLLVAAIKSSPELMEAIRKELFYQEEE